MTPDRRDRLRRLSECTMVPGSWDKRFVRDLSAKPEGYEPTPRQAETIDRLWHRYRRQLGHDDPAPAGKGGP